MIRLSKKLSRFYRTQTVLQDFCCRLSTKPVVKPKNETDVGQTLSDAESQTLYNVYPKIRTKLPQRAPFVKNFLLGTVDVDLLAYPELIKTDVDELETFTAVLEKALRSKEDLKHSKDLISRLATFRCLGLRTPLDEGGRNLNETEQCRLNELLFDTKYQHGLIYNELVILALSKYGSSEQKEKYLKDLIEGKRVATVNVTDSQLEEPNEPIISISNNFQNYILNGRKQYFMNIDESDFFIVFAKMNDSVKHSLQELDLTALLVQKNSPGVTIIKKEMEDPNLQNTAEIIFKDAIIPVVDRVGNERDGRGILGNLLEEHHLFYSIPSLTLMKRLLQNLAVEFLNKSTITKEIYKTEAVTTKLFDIVRYIYTAESLIYMTSGLKSTYENQDCQIETLITRVLSAQLAVDSTTIAYNLLGSDTLESSHYCNKFNREALSIYNACSTNGVLELLVALLGIQHAGKHIGDVVKKLRNPVFNASFLIRRLWQENKQYDGNPSLNLGLKNYLHLSCQESANKIEFCILRLQFVTETLFAHHGIDILNRHGDLRRLAIIISHIYAMIACISRASRSYCVGLKHCDYEIGIADMICEQHTEIVKNNIDEILFKKFATDKSKEKLVEFVYEGKNYYFSHPLMRNF